MSMFPCSEHGSRVPGKLVSVYWRWFNGNGESVGWKQRLCKECAMGRLKTLIAYANSESLAVSVCPACGTDSASDMDPIYATIFTPGSEGRELELTTCAACAAKIHVGAMKGAERLADRGGSRGAMAPREPDDPFEDLWS